jgi:hypothetical protein
MHTHPPGKPNTRKGPSPCTPLAAAIEENEADIIRITREEIRRTGIIQSGRQAHEMAREHFRSNEEGGVA